MRTLVANYFRSLLGSRIKNVLWLDLLHEPPEYNRRYPIARTQAILSFVRRHPKSRLMTKRVIVFVELRCSFDAAL